ncbi:MAG: F0F1 ATP synthase subunit B [Clostridiales bacterium]|nr:F0F1 ATP synthase subunit B [Clostridiales bacterium]
MEIHLPDLIFAIVNFLILLFLLRKFLYKPLLTMMDNRKKSIEDALDSAASARKEVAESQAVMRAGLAEARAKADEVLAIAQKNSEKLKEEILTQAKADAQAITDKAQAQIAHDREEAIAALRLEVSGLVMYATRQLLQEAVDETAQKRLFDKYINDIGQLQ